MKKSRKRQFNFLNFIVNWPKAISILEIFFLVLGVASGYFLYHFGYNVANTANNAHTFDIQTRKLLLAISLANAQFNDILDLKEKILLFIYNKDINNINWEHLKEYCTNENI